jgi:hypothetical protein
MLGNWGKKEASNTFVLSAIRTHCWADILPSSRYQYRCWFTLIVTSNECPRLPFQRITNFACDGKYRACSHTQFALHYMWNWHYTKSGTSRWLWEKPENVPEKCKLSNAGRKNHSTCLKGADKCLALEQQNFFELDSLRLRLDFKGKIVSFHQELVVKKITN